MTTTLGPTQIVQLQSFWNLIQTTDEEVQKELYVLLRSKYAKDKQDDVQQNAPSFLKMQGILRGVGNEETDRKMLDEFFQEKYGI